MGKVFCILVLLVMCLSLTGCWVHGQGSTIGFVTTVEDTSVFFGWDTVWFRVETGTYSSMQSKPEPYAILNTKTELKQRLLDTCRKNQKIELIYNNHVYMTHNEARGEVIDFRVIDN